MVAIVGALQIFLIGCCVKTKSIVLFSLLTGIFIKCYKNVSISIFVISCVACWPCFSHLTPWSRQWRVAASNNSADGPARTPSFHCFTHYMVTVSCARANRTAHVAACHCTIYSLGPPYSFTVNTSSLPTVLQYQAWTSQVLPQNQSIKPINKQFLTCLM